MTSGAAATSGAQTGIASRNVQLAGDMSVPAGKDVHAADSGARKAALAGPAPEGGTARAHKMRRHARSATRKIFRPASGSTSAYVVGPHDVLDIKVFDVAELSGAMQVSDRGTIDYPLLGTLKVAGRTTKQIQRELTRKLGAKYLQNPRIIVTVKEYKSQRFTVVGSVKKPGVYAITGTASLLQAVAMAGGLGDTSDASNVAIFRTINGKRHAARFDVAAIQAGRSPDPAIRRGDMIVVGRSQIKATLESIGKVVPIGSLFLPLL